MTPKHIEEIMIQVNKNWGGGTPEQVEVWLLEAYLLGQNSVRECVPEAQELLDKSNPDNYEACYAIAGFNACREQTLSNISKLQESNK